MRQITINQLNGRLSNNPTINFYLSLCTDKSRYSGDWRHKYFNYKRGERVDSLSPSGNYIYGAAQREFERLINSQYYNFERDHKRGNLDIEFSGYKLEFRVKAEQNIQGCFLSCETNFKPIGQSLLAYHSHKIKSNSTFADLDIIQYLETRILPKYLFANGIFRNIQIIRNCSKAEAIQFYKDNISLFREKRQPENDIYKAWKQLYKRRLNIEICEDLNPKYMAALFNSYTRQKTRQKLFKQPSLFEMAEAYHSENDTEDNMEQFVNDWYGDNYPKNSIFI